MGSRYQHNIFLFMISCSNLYITACVAVTALSVHYLGCFSLSTFSSGYFSPISGTPCPPWLGSFVFIFEKTKKCLELPEMPRKFNRHVCHQISSGVDRGLSRGSSVCRPGSKKPPFALAEFSYSSVQVKIYVLSQSVSVF